MADFTLDTSGFVPNTTNVGGLQSYRWNDLDPFTQGYIEALFASVIEDGDLVDDFSDNVDAHRYPAYRDLAPETLARIMEDCRAFRLGAFDLNAAVHGQEFWRRRQAREQSTPRYRGFPRLTPYLGDDGKVRLRPR